ncbi:hypothetical protein HSR122_2868 [Halapricum desulfuricans]|uniref:Uncharacterized protein n=1 Tax=Halapricum desulfuricans TaxID=2841257 RepID=A0A897NCN7_9EURY|nr:hypothetical protein HSR122_2868 [Halapricum desulfuricans]
MSIRKGEERHPKQFHISIIDLLQIVTARHQTSEVCQQEVE